MTAQHLQPPSDEAAPHLAEVMIDTAGEMAVQALESVAPEQRQVLVEELRSTLGRTGLILTDLTAAEQEWRREQIRRQFRPGSSISHTQRRVHEARQRKTDLEVGARRAEQQERRAIEPLN